MNKVKEIFSSDKHHADGTHSTSSSTTGHSTSTAGHSSAGTAGTDLDSLKNAHVDQVAPPPSGGHTLPKSATHLGQREAESAEHEHTHLAPVTHQHHHKHETEEVERERTINRHVHHTQLHEQKLLDEQHSDTKHHENVVPTTHVQEKHVNTNEDAQLLKSLNTQKDHYKESSDRQVVDKGERVHENVTHHVKHVVQPIVERDTHEHHVVHTKVPIVQETHEAPIVHQKVEHEPMKLQDFVKGGGDINSNHTIESSNALRNNDESCQRTTDGPLEALKEKLHLGHSKHDAPSTTTMQ